MVVSSLNRKLVLRLSHRPMVMVMEEMATVVMVMVMEMDRCPQLGEGRLEGEGKEQLNSFKGLSLLICYRRRVRGVRKFQYQQIILNWLQSPIGVCCSTELIWLLKLMKLSCGKL